MAEKINPLTIQSKKWLSDALIKQMQEKPFGNITIKEIAEAAQLDRRTFYRHFESKEELLVYYIDSLSKEYFNELSSIKVFTIFSLTKAYFEFWNNHIDFLVALHKNNLQIYLLNSYNQYLPELYERLKHQVFRHLGEEYYKFGLTFKIGGFWNILFEWVKNGAETRPEDMAKIVSELIENNMYI